jgi:hypothetical protein
MFQVDRYSVAKYQKPLYHMGPTHYLVPESITHHQLNTDTLKYQKDMTTVGRISCGELIADIRNRFKKYLVTLSHCVPELYELEMTQHRNLPGFYDARFTNYNAKRMVEDDKFIPDVSQRWKKRYWPKNIWDQNSPVPQLNEPYWHTTHSIVKSNNWILEHQEHMAKLIDNGTISDQEYLIIHCHLDDCYIDLPNQITHHQQLENLTV